jgi:hypothetical protein
MGMLFLFDQDITGAQAISSPIKAQWPSRESLRILWRDDLSSNLGVMPAKAGIQ